MAFNKRVQIAIFSIISLFIAISGAQATETLLGSYESATSEYFWGTANKCQYYGFIATTSNVTKISYELNATGADNVFIIGLATSSSCNPTYPNTETTPHKFATSTTFSPASGLGYQWYSWENPMGYNLTIGNTYYLKICNIGGLNTLKFHYNAVGYVAGFTSQWSLWSQNCNSTVYKTNFRVYNDPNPQFDCTAWEYTNWSDCTASSTQTREIATSTPTGCSGGTPEPLEQSCLYTVPIVYATTTYNIDEDMQKINNTFLGFVVGIYQNFWPVIMSFAVVAGFSFAIGRLFKKLG